MMYALASGSAAENAKIVCSFPKFIENFGKKNDDSTFFPETATKKRECVDKFVKCTIDAETKIC